MNLSKCHFSATDASEKQKNSLLYRAACLNASFFSETAQAESTVNKNRAIFLFATGQRCSITNHMELCSVTAAMLISNADLPNKKL